MNRRNFFKNAAVAMPALFDPGYESPGLAPADKELSSATRYGVEHFSRRLDMQGLPWQLCYEKAVNGRLMYVSLHFYECPRADKFEFARAAATRAFARHG